MDAVSWPLWTDMCFHTVHSSVLKGPPAPDMPLAKRTTELGTIQARFINKVVTKW